MKFGSLVAVTVAVGLACVASVASADTLKIASPQRGSWESSVPELGQEAGIFKKHGLDLDIFYTAGGGETLQAVVSGSADIGLSAGTLAILGAAGKGAPLRIIGASSTGSRELFWFVLKDSPIKSMREASGKTIAYSTTGSSTNIAVLRFIEEYKLKDAKPVATGSVAATITQAMSGQVDIGWSVAPFNLKPLQEGKIRVVGRASDIPSIRSQTIRVQITNAAALKNRKDAIDRFEAAYRETLDWMYSDPKAIDAYLKFAKFPRDVVEQTLKDFIPKSSLQTTKIMGLDDAMKDAVKFRYLPKPLTAEQISTLIQIPK